MRGEIPVLFSEANKNKYWSISVFHIGFIFAVLIISCVFVSHLSAEEFDQAEQDRSLFCRIVTEGRMTYRLGKGPWLSQRAGSFPAALPLLMKSQKSQCRIQIDQNTIIECAPLSEIEVRLTKIKGLVLSLKTGSVLYSKPRYIPFTIMVPSQGLVVQVTDSNTSETKQTSKNRLFDIGIVQVPAESDSKIEIANIRGTVSVKKGEDELQEVPVEKTLSMNRADSGLPDSATIKPFQVNVDAPLHQSRPIFSTEFGESNRHLLVPVKNDAWRIVKIEKGMFVESATGVGYIKPQREQGKNMDWVWCNIHNKYHPVNHTRP